MQLIKGINVKKSTHKTLETNVPYEARSNLFPQLDAKNDKLTI